MVTIWPYLSCILTIGTGKQPTVRADIFHSPSNSLSIPFANNTHRSKLRPQGRGLLRSGCRKRPAVFSGKRAAWRPGLDFCKMVVPSAMRSVISEAPVPGNDRASFSSCGCGRRNSARPPAGELFDKQQAPAARPGLVAFCGLPPSKRTLRFFPK